MAGVAVWNNGIALGIAALALAIATWMVELHVTELAEAPRIVHVSDSHDDTRIEEDAMSNAHDDAMRVRVPTDRSVEEAIAALRDREPERALAILEAVSLETPDDPRVHFHLALAHSRLGARDIAIDAYRKTLTLLPSYQAAAINLGLLLNEAARHDEARDALEHAVEITSGRRKAKSLLALGKSELALGANDEAVARFEQAIAYRPDYAPAWLWRGITLRRIVGRESEAEESIRNALKLRPEYANAWYELGVELSEGERLFNAIESLEMALDFDPDHGAARELLARLYHASGRKVSARKQYRLLANANRGTPKESFYRGEVALLRDEFETAIDHFNNARTTDEPLASRANQRLAEAYSGAADFIRALELYDFLLETQPANAEFLYGRALVQLKLGDTAQAETSLRRAIAERPAVSRYWFRLGRMLSELEPSDEAIAAYEESIRLRPDSRSAHLNVAVLYRRRGDDEAARGVYEKVLSFAPYYAAARFNLALLEADSGNDFAAANHYRRIVERDPAHHKAALNLAVILRHRDELEEAEALLRDVVARKPGLYSPRYNLALLLRAQGELDEAVTELSRVVALNETFAKGWRSLGRALQARGDLLAAGDALLSALGLEPDAPEALLDLAAAARAAGHTTAAADYYRAILRHDPEHEEANEGLYLVLTDIEEKRAKDNPS